MDRPDADGGAGSQRRAVRVVAVLGAVVVVGLAAVAVAVPSTSRPDAGVVSGDPAVPAGWRDVEVGAAVLSVPPGWQIVDGRGRPVHDGPCPDAGSTTLWLRPHPDAGPPGHCDPEPLRTAVQAAELGHRADGLLAGDEGQTTRLGAVAAWRTTVELSWHGVEAATGVAAAPSSVTTWLAPAIRLSVAVPDGLDAGAVLATVRPRADPDPDAVVLDVAEPRREVGERFLPAVHFVALDAHGRRHVWFIDDDAERLELLATQYMPLDWAGLAPDRFAVLEVARPHGVRVVAGDRDGGQVVWEQPEVARDLTEGSFPQAAWSPDGTAVVWYAPRAQPVMGLVQWDDVDAIARGRPPAREQTVAVADGPVQADPPVLRWTVEDGAWVVTFARGQPPPWDPALDLRERPSHGWRLPLERDRDGAIVLPDPVTVERLGAPG